MDHASAAKFRKGMPPGTSTVQALSALPMAERVGSAGIGARLRAHYTGVLAEPVPPQFLVLLDGVRDRDAAFGD